jgi:hypothetical protein
MKTHLLKKTLSYTVLLILFFAISGCGSTKLAVTSDDEVEIKQLCSGSEYNSTPEFIRANFLGESNDMAMSKKVAKSNTLAELASQIEVTVKAVIDNYNSRRQMNLNETIEKRYEELIRQVVNQNITGYKTICERVTKTKDNKYRTYLAIELPVDNVLNPFFNQISKDDELKVDYDYQKFKNTFEEEMKKVENQ